MIEIPLTQGQVTVIDDQDFDLVSGMKWQANKKNSTFYAITTQNKKCILMHRLITGAEDAQLVDHADADGLNNRRYNLRKCNEQQSSRNRGTRSDGRSPYKGIQPQRNGTWRARIDRGNDRVHLGYFPTETEAAVAYNFAALVYHGDYARLNVIDYGVGA